MELDLPQLLLEKLRGILFRGGKCTSPGCGGGRRQSIASKERHCGHKGAGGTTVAIKDSES